MALSNEAQSDQHIKVSERVKWTDNGKQKQKYHPTLRPPSTSAGSLWTKTKPSYTHRFRALIHVTI